MKFQERGVVFAVGLLILMVMLACRVTDTFIAQGSTATPTRTPRPTFTPFPPPTDTPIPLPPTIPPASPQPTQKPPTVRPSPVPTKKILPTVPPATQPAAPTAFPYTYHAYLQSCVHAGDTYIKGSVISDKNDPNSKIAGVKLRMSWAPDGPSASDVTVAVDDYTFILAVGGPKPGTYYVWVMDDANRRISELGKVVMNNLGPDDPNACWAAWLYFWKEPGR
jgi:hypothetical protein